MVVRNPLKSNKTENILRKCVRNAKSLEHIGKKREYVDTLDEIERNGENSFLRNQAVSQEGV